MSIAITFEDIEEMEISEQHKAPKKSAPKLLDNLVLNMPYVSDENQKTPVLEIPGFLNRVKPNAEAVKKYPYQGKQFMDMYRKLKKDFNAGRWDYNSEALIRELPLACWQKRFSKEELLMLYDSSGISHNEDVKNYLRENGDIDSYFFEKVDNSYHQSFTGVEWNNTVKAYNALKSFSFAELGTDFSIKYETSNYMLRKGYSRVLRIYLDGAIGILLYHKGEHVLTIALDFAHGDDDGKPVVKIQQIQCANKKGNRWLFKLPCHYFSYFAKLIFSHFKKEGFGVQIVAATQLVNSIREQYEGNYLKSKARFDEARQMSDVMLKAYGWQEHIMDEYENFKMDEERLVKIDSSIDRILSLYSTDITGLKRIQTGKEGYYQLVSI